MFRILGLIYLDEQVKTLYACMLLNLSTMQVITQPITVVMDLLRAGELLNAVREGNSFVLTDAPTDSYPTFRVGGGCIVPSRNTYALQVCYEREYEQGKCYGVARYERGLFVLRELAVPSIVGLVKQGAVLCNAKVLTARGISGAEGYRISLKGSKDTKAVASMYVVSAHNGYGNANGKAGVRRKRVYS